MSVHVFKVVGAAVLGAALLSACGGGGGDPAPETSNPPVVATFALKAGYKARIVNGARDDFNVSVSCIGTARIVTTAAVPSTFERVAGVSSAQVSTLTCPPAAPISATGTTYYNANYVPIGLSVVGGEYIKFDETLPPPDLPDTVKVGDKAVFATLIKYNDSSMVVKTGRQELSYEIKADTSTTAIANIITRSYDLVNLQVTETVSYRIAEKGALTLTLFDVQFSNISNTHLVYTPTPK